MPAKSKAQQKFMGAVLRCKKDKVCPTKEIKEASKSMTLKAIQDFLKPPKGAPKKVSKASMIEGLTKIANEMDSRGLTNEANLLDDLIKKI